MAIVTTLAKLMFMVLWFRDVRAEAAEWLTQSNCPQPLLG
jgi:hypothetical protein